MDRQIRLAVAIQVVLAQWDTTGHQFFKNPGGDRSALPHHLAGLPHVDRKQPHGHLGVSFPDTTARVRSLPQAHSPLPTEDAEQFIERQIRRKIQYRWILRQNSGEELPLPSGPIPALKTHGSISEAS